MLTSISARSRRGGPAVFNFSRGPSKLSSSQLGPVCIDFNFIAGLPTSGAHGRTSLLQTILGWGYKAASSLVRALVLQVVSVISILLFAFFSFRDIRV